MESHKLKHWQEKHGEEEGEPRFRVRLTRSFGDALTRQISESVRIDLRGENVLNSRTEYSRCRLPRLTLDKDEWRTAKRKKRELLEKEDSEDLANDTMNEDAVSAGQEEISKGKIKKKFFLAAEGTVRRNNK